MTIRRFPPFGYLAVCRRDPVTLIIAPFKRDFKAKTGSRALFWAQTTAFLAVRFFTPTGC